MASTMRIEHALGSMSPAEAKIRLQALGEYFTNKHGISVSWNGDEAKVAGKYMVVAIDGALKFEQGKALFEGQDPGMLWRGKAKEYIQGKLDQYLDPNTSVENLPRR